MPRVSNYIQPSPYYGGKQRMLVYIFDLIRQRPHRKYIETFAGMASVYFNKPKAMVNVLNDANPEIENFYRQLKTNTEELNKLIQGSLHSERLHNWACQVYKNPDSHSPLIRAYAFWIATIQSFGASTGQGFQWVCNKTDNWTPAVKIHNRKKQILECAIKLENCTLLNKDAVELIEKVDTADTLYYQDPPYVGARQGHYEGYKQEHFNNLLDVNATMKGDFILSSYPNSYLDEMTVKHGWKSEKFKKRKGVGTGYKHEVLTWNFDAELSQTKSIQKAIF